MIRSAFASIGFAIACAGMGVFTALGICIWFVKAEVNRQSETLSDGANKALDSASKSIEIVRGIIEKAEYDLAATRLEMLPQSPPSINPLIRLTAQRASRDLAGSVDRAHGAIIIASEAVALADTALKLDWDDQGLKKIFDLKPEQLDATREALGKVSEDLLKARDVLGPPTGSDAGPTFEQLHAVDNALRQARGFTDEVSKVVESTRTRVNETREKVDLWAWRTAVGTSAIASLGMIGQIFMARFFWRFLRRKSA